MADKRAIGIDSVVFDHKLFYLELDEPNDIECEVETTATGTQVVWQREILTPYITLSSKQNGWLGHDTKTAIMSLYRQLDTTFTLYFDDGSTEDVRFAHEKQITFTPLNEGCDTYTAQINLAKVIL